MAGARVSFCLVKDDDRTNSDSGRWVNYLSAITTQLRNFQFEKPGPRMEDRSRHPPFSIVHPRRLPLHPHWIRRARGISVQIAIMESVPTTLMATVAQRAPMSDARPPMNIAPRTRMTCVM